MATLLLDQTALVAAPAGEDDPDETDRRPDVLIERTSGVHGRFTLDDEITGIWEDLAVRAFARCPMCGGPMAAEELPGGDLRGLCRDCGTLLT